MPRPIRYPPVDIEELGDDYINHLDSMTSEGLHSKSDIAAQLAARDREIARLQVLLRLSMNMRD